jgi:hypothetical protein
MSRRQAAQLVASRPPGWLTMTNQAQLVAEGSQRPLSFSGAKVTMP